MVLLDPSRMYTATTWSCNVQCICKIHSYKFSLKFQNNDYQWISSIPSSPQIKYFKIHQTKSVLISLVWSWIKFLKHKSFITMLTDLGSKVWPITKPSLQMTAIWTSETISFTFENIIWPPILSVVMYWHMSLKILVTNLTSEHWWSKWKLSYVSFITIACNS